MFISGSEVFTSPRRTTLSAALLLAVTLIAAGCGSDPSSPAQGTTGTLQVVNGSAVPIDVRVDGSMAVTNLSVAAVSAALALTLGSHNVLLTPTGSASGGSAVNLDVVASGRRTVAATRVTGGAGTAVSAMALADTGSLVSAGRSKLRVLHLAANAPPLDIWRTQPDYQTPISILFPYAYLSGATVESAAGSWEVRVWPTGAGSWNAASSAITVLMSSGQLRTVVTLDVPGGGVKLQLLEQ
jgi:hypothetical protein